MARKKDYKVISPKDLETFVSADVTRQWYAGKNFTIGIAIHSGGGVHLPHVHEKAEEMIYVISGNAIVEFLPDGEKIMTGPGDIIHVPAGIKHAGYVKGFEPWKVVCVYSPPGAEQYVSKGEMIIPKGKPHDYKFCFEENKYKVQK